MNAIESQRAARRITDIPVNLPATTMVGKDYVHIAAIRLEENEELCVSTLSLVCLQTRAPALKVDDGKPLITAGAYQGSALILGLPPGEPVVVAQVEYARDGFLIQPEFYEPFVGPQTVVLSVYSNCQATCVVSATGCLKLIR